MERGDLGAPPWTTSHNLERGGKGPGVQAPGFLRREAPGSLAASSAFHPPGLREERGSVLALSSFVNAEAELIPEGPRLRGRMDERQRRAAAAKQVRRPEPGAQRAVFAGDLRRHCGTRCRGLASFFGLRPFR